MCDCDYFSENVLGATSPELLFKILRLMNKRGLRFLWADRDENIILCFEKEVILNDDSIKTLSFSLRDVLL